MTSETARPGAPAAPAPPDPGDAAPDAPAARGVVVRRVATLEEYHECVAIQRETWGAGFSECVPATILLVAQKLGGVVAGAFTAGGRMLGFVFGMAGVVDGRPTHWSDMLAVRPEARGAHLGERLKRCQRELARAAGAEAMYWTFDPLVARNAHLNLARLGARAVEYVPNMYGADTGSPLHGGLPTDRLVARWDLVSSDGAPGDGAPGDGAPGDGAPGDGAPGDGAPRDGGGGDGPPRAGPPRPGVVLTAVAPDGTPTFVAPPPDAARVRISVPDDVDELAPALRSAWRAATREAFLAQLRRGYLVTAFRRAAGGELPYYELERAGPPAAAARPTSPPRRPPA